MTITDPHDTPDSPTTGIAIIGLAGRFPGAEDVQAFWENLLAAKETISTLRREELAAGEPVDDPEYVPRRGVLAQAEWLDAAFFGLSRIEAEVTDPQQRVFLEVAWTALEQAGYDPRRLPGVCGVWAGTGNNHYLQKQLSGNAALLEAAGAEALMIGNEKDYIATRVAYRLNLRGPAINVVTACSTSLVAVAQAVQGLMTHQCDLALAGGASIRWPQNRGYLHEDGSIFSPDGHCRAFDEKSAGTVFSSGAGCVVLKREEEARRDGDTIYAVIKSAALNNDGAAKVSFTAPGVDGQAENVTMALALADAGAETIDFVEAHGTGTALGDVIEVAALTQAFRACGDERVGGCVLGSLKTATGHMDAAAGVGGLIKTALALHHGVVPGTLHFSKANPKLDLGASPFRVSAESVPLGDRPGPRRALVAALGVGGTNAHLVVESASGAALAVPPAAGGAGAELPAGGLPVLLSARSAMALAAMRDRLARHLEAHPETNLRDAAFTLARGRTVFAHRAAIMAGSAAEALAGLREAVVMPPAARPTRAAFLFPGQGSQHARMGRELEQSLPVFRAELDRCRGLLGIDPLAGTDEELARTSLTQPALFALSFALARQYEAWGVTAAVFLGHSIGEYVAATLSGVFSLEDALRLVRERGRIMQAQPAGVMLAVRGAEEALELPATLDLAAVNAPQLCVVSGTEEAIAAYEGACEARGLGTRRLRTSHAFHSRLMDGALEEFRRAFHGVTLHPPERPVISNLTGTDLTAEQATSPEYWVHHLRNPVRFAAGVAALKDDHVLLEVGPSTVLSQLARQAGAAVASSLPAASAGGAGEARSALAAVGALWTQGVDVDWEAHFPAGTGRRIALPTYPFERQRFCPDLPDGGAGAVPAGQPGQPGDAGIPASAALPGHALPARDLSSLEPVFAQTAATAAAAAPALAPRPRREHLVLELQTQLLKISGIDVAAQPATTAFLDLGFDSLFLTQAGTALKKHFGIKITFRQLMEELTSIEALAGHLDAQLPPGKFDPAAASAPARPAAATAPRAGAGELDARLSRIEHALAKLTGEPAAGDHAEVQAPHFSVRVREQKGGDAKKIAFGPFKPINTNRDGTLTPQQRGHLAHLIAEYCAKYPASKEFTARNRDHFADPRAVGGFNPLWKEMVFPAVTDRSEGAHLWDVDGNQWIDVVHGFGSGFFGHRPGFVVEALKAQLDRGFEIGPTHPLAGEVARLIRDFSGQDRVAFSNTGSESLMAAIRVARTVTGRDKIAMFAGAYHGIFDEVLARPLVVNGELRSIPIAPGIPESAQANLIVLEYGHLESLEIIRRHGHELAAVLVEPVPSRRPDIAPVEFVQELRRITALSETALIFDEVVLGWRTCPQGAQRLFGIDADLVAYGKVVGGGMPLGVLAGKRRFMDALDGGQWNYGDDSAPEVGVTFFAGTFIRHPLTLAACKAVLDRLLAEGPDLQRGLDARTEHFVAKLNAVFADAGVPVTVTRYSSLWMLNADPGLKFFSLLFYHLRLRGIHIWEGRGNFLSTAHTDEHCADILRAFVESVNALQQGGFFPEGSSPDAAAAEPTTASPAASPQAPGAVPSPGSAAAAAAGPAGPSTLPLTPEQQELYLSAKLSPEASVAAHESVTIQLRGRLDQPRLERALALLSARHEALRVSFAPDGSHQRVAAESVPPLQTINPDRLEEEKAVQFLEPFDLATAPLWRVALAAHGAEEHSLLLTAHHLVCDGWSFGVIAHELARLYRGEPLPPATPLREVVMAEREPEAAAYWQREYAVPPATVELPADRTRPAHPDYAAATLWGAFDDALAARLREFCRSEKATPNAVLLTAWQILLHRLTGERDIVVGTPIAGQPASGRTSIVAHQVHFLPVRVAVDRDLTASALLARTRGKLADATDHQDYTLGQLYQDLALPRQPGRPSFVTTTFTCESAASAEDWGGGLEARLQPNPKRCLAFDASLFIILDGAALRWQLVCREQSFDEATARHWMRCLETVLASMVENPDGAVERLEMLAPADAELVQTRWNHAGDAAPPASAIHELFERQADRTPGAPALLFGESVWTYAELERRANQFAHELLAAGLRPAQKVALVAARSPQMVAAVLGILKAGGSYAPMDAAYPNERLGSMLRDLASTVLACDPPLRGRLQSLLGTIPATLLEVTAEAPAPWSGHTERPGVAVPGSAPAYIIYTSGSTGQPKGAVIPHRAVVRLVRGQDFAAMTPAQTWLQLAPLSFDACTLELFAPLLNGGRLALMPPGTPSLVEIGAAVRRHGVTSLWLTAGLFQLMVDERLDDLEPLQELLTGGDVVSVPHARRVLQRFPRLRLVNGYGPTENTTFTCCHAVTAADLERTALPIGRPIAHTSVFIVDENDQPCAVGVAGELLTGGLGLAQSYWRREDLTAEKFVDHPRFGRVYRTGDRARWRWAGHPADGPQGVIEFLGRADTQIKVRGFRIEPGEIEAALLSHPGVRQAAVRARGASAGDRRLAAWWVPAGPSLPEPAELRAHLRVRLPEYMVPQEFVMVPGALPLTPNGKIDEKALPLPSGFTAPDAAAGAVRPPASIAPRTTLERRLHGLMQESLGRDHFGVEDDFFELGGDSLRGLRFFTLIEKELGRALPLGTLFTAPTVAGLARVLGDAGRERPRQLIQIQPHGSESPLFLIHGGDGGVMFYRKAVAQLDPDQPVYGIEAPMLTDATLRSPGASVHAIAEDYLALVRQVQPLGPYRLGGYSFGGVVAYEMARLLLQEGEVVDHLFLFDTDNPAVPPRYFSAFGRVKARWQMDGAAGLSLAERGLNLLARVKWGLIERRRLRREVDAVKAARASGRRADESVRPVEVREANMELMASYVPPPTDQGLTLFRCRGLNDKFEHTPALGWEEVVRTGLEVIPVTGTHLKLFEEPHVTLLADRLASCLGRPPAPLKRKSLDPYPA